MGKYLGYHRSERVVDMAATARLYGNAIPLVDAEPVFAAQIRDRIDRSGHEAGGQGRFYLLEGTDGAFAVKLFDVTKTDPHILKERAKRVESALRTIARKYPPGNFSSVVLFNQLNIPKRYISSADGKLVGLVVPVAPSSCYIKNDILDRSVSKLVRLRHVICAEERLIHPEKNSNSPLSEAAKWSILDSLCQTIASFHDLHLIHGDLSSNNVLVRWAETTDPKVYIIDAFNGFSDSGGNNELGHMFSDVYCPTSVKNSEYTTASDVYCLAWWIMHIAIAMDPSALGLPLPDFNVPSTVRQCLYLRHEYVVKYLPDAAQKLPKWLFTVLCESLEGNPDNRPNAWELAYAVHDYWIGFGDAR